MTTPPTPKKSMRWWVILLIVFGVMALLGLLAVGGIVWWFSANKDRLAAVGREATVEGEAFARDHEQSACVDEGLRKVTPCDGVMCEAQMKIFTATCVRNAAPTPGFCDDVPSKREILKMSRWAVEECTRRGKPNNQRCTRLVQAVPEACHAPGTTDGPAAEE